MTSHIQQIPSGPPSRGFGRAGGIALIVVVALLLLAALMSNPVLP
jgi:hypothetical protein